MLLKKYGIDSFENMSGPIKVGLIASFLLLLAVNVVMLDLAVFFGRTAYPSEIAARTVRVIATPAPTTEAQCSPSCEAQITALSRDMDQKIDAIKVSTPTSTATTTTTTRSGAGAAKEYYITLGSGMTKANAWQELAGVEAVVDTANYPPIKSVTFEVYLKIPTANGNVHAKLYNVTDKHDVWFSEVNSEGPILTKKEATITLENGAKTYRVMGLSTLKYDANIDNARLRILTY